MEGTVSGALPIGLCRSARLAEVFDEVFALCELLLFQTEDCTDTFQGKRQTHRGRPYHGAAPALRVEILTSRIAEEARQADAFKGSVEGPFDNGLILQGCQHLFRNFLAAGKVNDFHRSVIDTVGKEQYFKIGRLAVTVDTGLLERNVTVGLDIDTECFHRISPFNDTSGRERIPAACFGLLVALLVRMPCLPVSLQLSVSNSEDFHDALNQGIERDAIDDEQEGIGRGVQDDVVCDIHDVFHNIPRIFKMVLAAVAPPPAWWIGSGISRGNPHPRPLRSRTQQKEYPHLPGYAKVIDNYMTYAQSAIDEFSDPKKLPQIAISVDMLDTGIDVPEVLNLVFFKKVMSKAKFWQMIGRGTRLCPALLDGRDKDKFYIFDFCGNFEFFRMSKGKPTANMIALQGAIFHLKAQIAFKLQDLAYQTTDLIAFRKTLVDDMVRKVQELNKDNFAVRQHLKYVELYANADNYAALTYEDTLLMGQELAPLITPEEDDPKALRFDALMYGIELAYLAGKKYGKARSDLMKKVAAVASVANIPEIMAQSDLLNKILHTDFLETAGINEFEHIRENLRNLIKYIPVVQIHYDTILDDEILSEDWNESELENDDLKNYKAKAEFYVRQHTDNAVIAKLKGNIPLNSEDVKALEEILWNEIGTKQDYEAEYGQKPLGEFVREIVGLDMNAAKEAFAQYLNDASLDSRQIYFVNQIVEYIVHNGMMKDLSVLQEAPFTDRGSIVEVFTDLSVWAGIRKAIERVNANAVAA